MSRVCQITGKRPASGNNRSKSCRATKRRFLPNIIKKRIFNPKTGKMEVMKIAASTLKTLTKKMK